MNISTPRINPYTATSVYSKLTEQPVQHQVETEVIRQESSSFQEEMMMQENLQVAAQNESVLNEREKATLHALFGAEKPSEMSFYGHTQLQHIHRGQLLDING